ncbi:glycosyltransferase family 4 protein [Flavobacteriaceae bacterium F89]|uniref:Glycosyltransferase family 4 protein n=1 Tax=Cerina litoralis TaxID=2874477 RepID=A0AAE3EYL0_9FLAO|nr:glycosyltransferase family 4 protein [Cerina litoralis]MCG2462880.1 glycosyltransferase family 4 protein [Cerina litoralis]
MTKKKILISIDWFLPGTRSGGPVRSYANLIAQLGEYFNFYVITRDTDYCADEVYPNIISDTWNRWDAHTQIYYFSKKNLSRKNIKNVVEKANCDFLYVNGIYSWYFSILPVLLFHNKIKTVVSARGMLNPHSVGVKGTKKKMFLRMANAMGLYRNITFHATNPHEAEHIKTFIGKQTEVKVAPNLPRALPDVPVSKKKNKKVKFVNVARISKEKGTLKMLNAFRSVKDEVVLDLYGPVYDDGYWAQCKNSIDTLPKNVSVHYKGSVEGGQIPELLTQYDFFMMLSEGENFGHAILEAFSAGCPVLISDTTPWKDLKKQQVGWDVALNDKAGIEEALAQAILMEDAEYQRWSQNAYEYARTFCQNPELIALNLALFK